jgi:hypothetical protein
VILNNYLPSEKKTLGTKTFFADCFFGTRQRRSLPSVFSGHSAKIFFAECYFFALGKELLCRVSEKLHSANHLALDKELVSGSEYFRLWHRSEVGAMATLTKHFTWVGKATDVVATMTDGECSPARMGIEANGPRFDEPRTPGESEGNGKSSPRSSTAGEWPAQCSP